MPRESILSVVIPAYNEEFSIEQCISSVAISKICTSIFVSNNFSTDATQSLLSKSKLEFNLRDLPYTLNFVSHIVDSGRWALKNSESKYYCFLAADDLFSEQYVDYSISFLDRSSEFAMTFPDVRWFSGQNCRNSIKAPDLGSKFSVYRQVKALSLPNSREIGNQMYGVFTRNAFEYMLDRFEEYGECFGADFLATVSTLKVHRSQPVHRAPVFRRVREGADLRERIGFTKRIGRHPFFAVLDYVKLHLAITDSLAKSISSTKNRSLILVRISLHSLRFPQMISEVPIQVIKRLRHFYFSKTGNSI